MEVFFRQSRPNLLAILAVMVAPLPQNEIRRLEVLHACAILDTPPEAGFDLLAAEVAVALETPIAVIGFIDQERHWFKAKFGTDVAVNKRQWATCAHTIYHGSTLACSDLALEPRFTDMPPLAALGLKAYAGTPIVVDGCAVGTVCVFDYRVRPFAPDQLAALERFAKEVANTLAQRNAQQRLLERVRRVGQAQSKARLEWLGANHLRLEHDFVLPLGRYWQLWAVSPTEPLAQKLEAFRQGQVEIIVPPLSQLLLLSLEPDHIESQQPTQVLAALPLVRHAGQPRAVA
jgi:GAF domain-containing protein